MTRPLLASKLQDAGGIGAAWNKVELVNSKSDAQLQLPELLRARLAHPGLLSRRQCAGLGERAAGGVMECRAAARREVLRRQLSAAQCVPAEKFVMLVPLTASRVGHDMHASRLEEPAACGGGIDGGVQVGQGRPPLELVDADRAEPLTVDVCR